MKRSYFFKSFLLTVLLISVSFMLLGGAIFAVMSQYAMNEARDRLERSARTLSVPVAAFLQRSGLTEQRELQTVLQIMRDINQHEVLVCDGDGNILYHMLLGGTELQGSHISPDIVGEILDQGSYFGIHALSGVIDGERIAVGVPVYTTRSVIVSPWNARITESVPFVLLVTASYDEQRDILRFFLRSFIGAGLIALLVTFMVAYWTSRRMVKPLTDMAEAARSFGGGDFSVRLRESGRSDELGELTLSFNAMAESLGRAEELRRGFIDNVSHELRTPMTTIAGTVDGILDGTVPDERRGDYLRTVSSEVRRLSRMVGRLADLTRLETRPWVTMAPFDLSETARRVLLGFEARIREKELPVAAAFSDGALWALGDEDAVTQVLHNLVENAVKFSSAGEPLVVSVTRGGDKVVFSIENGGSGIPPEDLPFVFDRFFKADRSRSADREGLGLGLYLTRSILRGMNGEIRASSADGRTKFTFTLDEAAR